MQFGLTHQEAKLYICLYQGGQATGYELAKLSGISRSNAYAGLSSLVEKGGAWLIDGKPACYQAVPPGEFCDNVIRGLGAAKIEVEKQLPHTESDSDSYLTIRGERNIRDKIETMLRGTQRHIYLSMKEAALRPFCETLRQTAARGCKVVVIMDGDGDLGEGITVYHAPEQSDAIRIISDTKSALTGSLDDTPGCSCLFSRKENLVRLLRDSMSNEIKLIQLTGGKTS